MLLEHSVEIGGIYYSYDLFVKNFLKLFLDLNFEISSLWFVFTKIFKFENSFFFYTVLQLQNLLDKRWWTEAKSDLIRLLARLQIFRKTCTNCWKISSNHLTNKVVHLFYAIRQTPIKKSCWISFVKLVGGNLHSAQI